MLQARIMFTGLITGLGEIKQARKAGIECRFVITPLFHMEDLKDGESIAIDGVCLSVENHTESQFSVYASGETLARTNLDSLRPGQKVNLERALKVGQRLDGHIVSGHIDCLATLVSKEDKGSSIKMRLQFPDKYAPQVISKGSIALNGISLTVNSCAASWLEVNIIPDSQKRTNIPYWQTGNAINMETDIIGKYVQHIIAPWTAQNNNSTDSTLELLAKNGFI